MIIASEPILQTGAALYGPYAIPDAATRFSVTLARNAQGQRALWASTDTIVAMQIEVAYRGRWVSAGGIPRVAGGDNGRTAITGLASELWFECAVCGNMFPQGDARYTADNDEKKPYVMRGALAHSDVALRSGVTLQQLRDAATAEGKTITTLADIRLRVLRRDEELLARTFHTPTAILPAQREIRVTLDVTGPQLRSALQIEAV